MVGTIAAPSHPSLSDSQIYTQRNIPPHLALLPKKRNSLHKPIRIRSIPRNIHPINRNLEPRPHSIRIIQRNPTRLLNRRDAALANRAVALVAAAGGVVVEEGVEACAVDEDGLGVHDAETPAVD